VTRLLVDGTNLLHALRRRQAPDQAGAALPGGAAIIGRLRASMPPTVEIELVFDGPPEHGAARRIASGITVSYSGRRSADAVIVDHAELAAFERSGSSEPGPEGHSGVLVVTDDAELRRAIRTAGASSARTAWLLARLDRPRLSSPSIGRPTPAHINRPGSAGNPFPPDDGSERPGWRTGRGATRKTGNPKRSPKRSRGPSGLG
jgi:hypothetical protein